MQQPGPQRVNGLSIPRGLLECPGQVDVGAAAARLAWGRHLFEEERRLLGEDPWPYGVKRNRANLERFMGYSLDQGLIGKKLVVGDLFAPSTLDT